MEYDENDVIDYDNDELMDNNITELNIIENNDDINQNTLQTMLNEYKQKEIVHDNRKNNLKYSVELLALLKKVMSAMLYTINLWIGYLLVKTLMYLVLPKRDAVMKQLSKHYMMDELYPEQKMCSLKHEFAHYVPVHSFVDSLITLLTASDLMKSDNLLFANSAFHKETCPHHLVTSTLEMRIMITMKE